MIKEITDRVKARWRRLDWKWRVYIFGLISLAIVLLVTMITLSAMKNKMTVDSLMERGSIVSQWFADANKEALLTNRPELAEINAVMNQPAVDKAVIFDFSGGVFAPVSMRGNTFSNKAFFEKIISGRSVVRLINDDGRLEVFRPIINGSKDGASGNVSGVAYLNLGSVVKGIGAYIIFTIVFLSIGFCLFLYWLVMETNCSIRSAVGEYPERKFGELGKMLAEKMAAGSLELSRHFENEWRSMIHVVWDPVIVLDRQYRLVEMNEAAMDSIGSHDEVAEGRHVVDMLENSPWLKPVVTMLGELEKSNRRLIRRKELGTVISIFCLGKIQMSFQYTIVFSGVGKAVVPIMGPNQDEVRYETS